MKISKVFVLFLLAMIVLVAGCGQEPPGPATSAEVTEKLNQANQILVPRIILIVNSTNPDPTAFDLSAAASLYQQVLALDPNNPGAHFGLGLIDLLSLGGNPDIRQIGTGGNLSITPRLMLDLFKGESKPGEVISGVTRQLKEQFLGAAYRNTGAALGKGTVELSHRLPSFYQNILETVLLPKLASAINHLTVVTQNPNYAFIITPQMTGGATTETYRIDLTEIYLLLALVQGVASEVSFLVSYNVDYDSVDSMAVSQAWQLSSSFLALRANGVQRMRGTRQYFLGMATSIQGSLNHLMNEPPNPEVDLINYNPADEPVILSVIMVLDSVKDVFSAPYTLPDGVTINLVNFFDDPIPNYKQMVPAYSTVVEAGLSPGRYDAILTWSAGTFDAWMFPDPTMRGLFPGMTDADLKQLLGLSPATWTQSVRIEG